MPQHAPPYRDSGSRLVLLSRLGQSIVLFRVGIEALNFR